MREQAHDPGDEKNKHTGKSSGKRTRETDEGRGREEACLINVLLNR